MKPAKRNPNANRRRAWQQQALGIIIIALIAFAIAFARFHRALLK
jgi:hypothetical protein